ncbi:late competence protein ComER [Sporolactobacillus shoreae]|uniref:Pyrroline-5-carboxylate reductase n=1 Tax=Sporolactobacillus shoreae TaxID=1465501 RepID=A0A4Z0GSL5_9BACL|nr:late competence protein ComER [Sporolactobacillus shoreae]TGA99635.1 late competence protein ComER [Sporolactobacillus shoreae]
MRIGVIGTGNIGSLIVSALIRSKSAKAKTIYVTNRTPKKAHDLAAHYPGLKVCGSSREVIRRSDTIFLCVRPQEYFGLLQPLRGVWYPEQLAVSVTSPIRIAQLEKLIPCHTARVVPSIVNQSLSGSTLVTFGSSLTDHGKYKLWNLLGNFSQPLEVSEKDIRVASDISSCGPAFLSFVLEKMIDGAVAATSISKKEATELATQMTIGYGKLLEEKKFTLQELRDKVTVKGGVTGAGLAVLNQEYSGVFEHLFEATKEKFLEDHQALDPFFDGID